MDIPELNGKGTDVAEAGDGNEKAWGRAELGDRDGGRLRGGEPRWG